MKGDYLDDWLGDFGMYFMNDDVRLRHCSFN